MAISLRLTLDIAEKFLEDSAAVDLEQFNSITNDAAAALTGEEELSLNGLTNLSDAAAVALAKHKGALYLNGLTSLSDAAVAALAKHEGSLFLNGLTSLSNASAAALSKHEEYLSLDGLTTLSDGTVTLIGNLQAK